MDDTTVLLELEDTCVGPRALSSLGQHEGKGGGR